MKKKKKTEIGKIAEIINLENGKIFLHDTLNLTGCEISVNVVPIGFKLPFNHQHIQNEEIYIVLKGEGIITVDKEKVNVKEGSILKIAPNAIRTLENTGNTSFEYICIQAKENSLEQFGLKDAELC